MKNLPSVRNWGGRVENMFKKILNHLGNTAVYIVRRDTHEILYFNDRVREVTPQVRLGAVCHELWRGACSPCPLTDIGERETNTVIGYNDPFGKVVSIAATKTEWNHIPAFLISVTPHILSQEEKEHRVLTETLNATISSAFDEVFYADLSTGELLLQKSNSMYQSPSGNSYSELGLRLLNTMHPRDQATFQQMFSQASLLAAFQSGESRVYQQGLRRAADGQYHWISLEAVRLYSEPDHHSMALLLLATIDETKHLEYQTQLMSASILSVFGELIILDLETEQYYVQKADASTAAALSLTPSPDFTSDNRRYGLSLIHPDDQERFFSFFNLQNMRKSVSSGSRKFFLEVRRRDGTGQYRWCEMIGTVVADEHGVHRTILLTFRDIDELHRAQQQQRAANQRFMNAVNAFYDAIYEYDLTTRGSTIWKTIDSERGPAILLQKRQLDWDECLNAVHPDYRQAFSDAMSRDAMLQTLGVTMNEISLDLPVCCRDSVYRWFSVQIQLLERTEAHVLTMVYLKNIDVAKQEEERKQAALRDALALAERSNSAKSDFFSRMSHDIRTPMNAILGMSRIAAANLHDSARIAECIDKIQLSSNFLLSLINDVLDMSKIESGKLEINPAPFDLRKLIAEIATICEQQAAQKKQRFTVSIDPLLGQLYTGDALRLKQIVMNLLSNAMKYSPVGGKIALRLTQEPPINGVNYLSIQVQDNGIGMTPAFLKRIFEPFEQEHVSDARTAEGSGLGLAITRNLVHLMNGEVSVESTVERGSEFRVLLPLEITDSSAAALAPPVDSESAHISLADIRVLLVEDNALNLEIAQTLLEMDDIQVETAQNGEQAVTRFRASAAGYYDAILMDIRMPVMDGLEATRQIRHLPHPDARDIPIIAMTANAFQNEQQDAKNAGITGYVSKPIELERLYEVLRGELYRRRQKNKAHN